MKPIGVLLAALLLFTGCDVPGRLYVKNRSSVPMSVQISGPLDPKPQFHDTMWVNGGASYHGTDTGHTISFDLQPHRRIQVYGNPYSGFGWRWSKEAVQQYAEGLRRFAYTDEHGNWTTLDSRMLMDRSHWRRKWPRWNAVLVLP
jgi:hypothetical protein